MIEPIDSIFSMVCESNSRTEVIEFANKTDVGDAFIAGSAKSGASC